MPNTRRRVTGYVVSNKMDKTVVVQVERTFRHPLYGKVVRSAKRFMAHDEGNECEIGDEVLIVESRPISKNKRWVVQEILREDLSARTLDVADLEGMAQDIIEVEDETDEESEAESVEELDAADEPE